MMPTEIKDGPLVTLVLALSSEIIDMIQATHDALLEDGDIEGAKQASIKLERLCMLQSLVEMHYVRDNETVNERSAKDIIVAYLQEHDPAVFPINIREDGKLLLLDTLIGISADTGHWLDTQFPGQIAITKPVREMPAERTYQEIVSFKATRTPGFVPELLPTPPLVGPAKPQHKAEINSGMTTDGTSSQGMPGGRLGDR